MTKLIVVVGATGNQGGSVAARFLQDPAYKVRALTRNPSSAASQKLAAAGAEVVQCELDSVDSLKSAFKGANLIFSVTQYWEPFFRPDSREIAAKQNITCRKYAANVEYQQGVNIADAAATVVDTLEENGFIPSTLSSGKKCAPGKYPHLYHFDAKADVFPDYVNENYPELAKKMSCVQTGYFTSSYLFVPDAYFTKMPDSSYLMAFPMPGDKPVPHLSVNADTGNFVYAVSQLPPGNNYMAEGTTCGWTEYIRIFSEVTGQKARYEVKDIESFVKDIPDQMLGEELGDMFLYSGVPGYDGGDETLVKAADIRKMGIDCPMTSLEEWMKQEDWSKLLGPDWKKDLYPR